MEEKENVVVEETEVVETSYDVSNKDSNALLIGGVALGGIAAGIGMAKLGKKLKKKFQDRKSSKLDKKLNDCKKKASEIKEKVVKTTKKTK